MLCDYIGQDELVCQDPYLRNIEKSLYEIVRHADEIGDDIVVDFVFPHSMGIGNRRLWRAYRSHSRYQQRWEQHRLHLQLWRAVGSRCRRLHLRDRCVDRTLSLQRKERLEGLFGDILPIRLGGYDPFDTDTGYKPWLGNLFSRADHGPASFLNSSATTTCSIGSMTSLRSSAR